MDNPRVSVIVPVFNAEQFLDKSLRSILDQTFKDFECIVINDGSSDSSGSIVEAFANSDQRFKAIHRGNRGLVSTLNEAIRESKGEFIARMDADDIAYAERLERQVNFFDSNPGVQILGGQAKVIDGDGKPSGVIRKPLYDRRIRNFLENGCPIIHPTYMVRRGVYEKLDGYREVLGAEDLEFLIRSALAGFTMANLSSEILYYRINSEGESAKNALRQMKTTRLLCSRYRQLKGSKEYFQPASPILNESDVSLSKRSFWFELSFSLRNWFLEKSRGQHKPINVLCAMACSLLHYELFFAGLRAVRNRRV